MKRTLREQVIEPHFRTGCWPGLPKVQPILEISQGERSALKYHFTEMIHDHMSANGRFPCKSARRLYWIRSRQLAASFERRRLKRSEAT